MLLFAGKGIRGGQVIGATDLDKIDERGDYSHVSDAHKSKDAALIKRMGKPFNFETAMPCVMSEEFTNLPLNIRQLYYKSP